MVDFRRMIPVLAVLALMLGLSGTASAQLFSCTANGATNVPNRSEGLTEQEGDFVVTCIGGTPTASGVTIPTVNIQIFLNTAITSRLMSGTTIPGAISEALLILDEPAPGVLGAQFGCATATCANVGNGAGGFVGGVLTPAGYYGGGAVGTVGNNRNIFQGVQTASNAITFFGVPIDPPGTTGSRVIRITNIRGNANALGLAGANQPPVPVNATITATPANFFPVSGLATQAVGSVQRGLQFGVFGTAAATAALSPLGLQQCVSRASGAAAVAFLRYSELFGTAFKKKNVASSSTSPTATGEQNNLNGNFNTETFFTTGALTGGSLPALTVASPSGISVGIGQADFGSRLKAVFNNLPAGVSIFVDTRAAANFVGGVPQDVAQLTATEAGIFSAVTAGSGPAGSVFIPAVGATPAVLAGTAQLTITNNSATAVWEVLDSAPQSLATFNFGVFVTFTASPATNSPALATATVNGSYAPTSTVTTASAGPIPRFADTSTAQNVFTIVPCVTNLLFPYVTSAFGFDTGIAISSTSTDPFGTSAQSGTCTLNWFGAAFTGTTPTPVINSGTTFTTLTSLVLSNVTGGFSGYMIAQCRFQYAHAMAFITDLGARNLAMGYLALIIPDPALPRTATPFECAAGSTIAGCVGSGEQLGY
jgi:hypothetical protein